MLRCISNSLLRFEQLGAELEIFTATFAARIARFKSTRGLYEATMRLLEKEYFVRDGKP